jgi:hypothetical protein
VKDHEWQDVAHVFAGLWPKQVKGLTDEEVAAYRRVCDGRPPHRCIVALRGLAETMRFFPRPAEVRERLQLIAGQQSPSKPGSVKPWTRWDTQRAQWANAEPHRRDEIMGWSDDECELRLTRWDFERAAEVYGPEALSTVRAWQFWQRVRLRLGHRSEMVEPRHDDATAMQQYEAEGGLAEAMATQARRQGR